MQAATKLRYDNFVDNFAANKWQNATKAAIQAGYKVNRAKQQASNLCTILYVKERIAQKKVELAEIVEYNKGKARRLIEVSLAQLEPLAKKGNIAAITAKTGLLRELNDIFGLHKQIHIDETSQQKELTEAKKAKIDAYLAYEQRLQGIKAG